MERENNIKKLFKLVNNNIIAKNIEESVFLFTTEYTDEKQIDFLFDSIYNDKFNEIYNLLTNKKSTFLIKALIDKTIDPLKIAFMRPDELNPEKYDIILKKKEVEDFKLKNQTTSSTFKCPKCKERKVTVIQKQTRSADEPATTFITCNSCGYSTMNDDS